MPCCAQAGLVFVYQPRTIMGPKGCCGGFWILELDSVVGVLWVLIGLGAYRRRMTISVEPQSLKPSQKP